MVTETKKGKWKAGESGNPKGRPCGSSEVGKLRAAIGGHVPEIIERLVNAARGGDIQAAKLILERVLPPVRAVEQAIPIDLPKDGTLTDQGRAVLLAVGAGELAPGQGAQLLAAIGTLGKIAEFDELNRRITLLEDCANG